MPLNKIRCNVTGLWFGISKSRREKLLTQFNTMEELEEVYVSRVAKRYLKDGKSEEDIRALVEQGVITSNTEAPKRLKATNVVVDEDDEDPEDEDSEDTDGEDSEEDEESYSVDGIGPTI
ncbi:MAG: hypothetical protein ACFFKA_00655 [Candidatus Thorarchaeota archaeon]